MMRCKPTSYEECRLRRLEENRKRMESLNLPLLAYALSKRPSSKPLPPMKRMKRATSTVGKHPLALRRSSRVANKLAHVYGEVTVSPVNRGHLKIPRKISAKKDLLNRVYALDEASADAIENAEQLELRLESECPTFIKSMVQSHVTGEFWLGLPGYFCRKNLPKHDEVITLINEEGDEYPTIYLATKTGLSGGWKDFTVAHGLEHGEALVFQLIRSTTLKVYLIRVYGSEQRNSMSHSES